MGLADYSALILATWITSRHFSVSSAINFPKSVGVIGIGGITAPVRDTSELEFVVAALAREPNSGLIVMPEAFMNVHRAEVTSLAAHYHLPAVYPRRFFAELGGLLSYGNDLCLSETYTRRY